MATRTPKTVEHPLAHRIPDISFSTSYISREIGGYRDLDLLKYAQDYQQNVLLTGDTGLGKTSVVYAYAALTRQPVVKIQCNGGIDPNTFWGSYSLDEETQTIKWFYSEYAIGIQHGPCVVLYDEISFMPPKVTAANHGVLDKTREAVIQERGNEVLYVHEKVLFVATANIGYHGTRALNQAFMNRWHMKLDLDYDEKVESQLINMPVVLEIAKKLRIQRSESEIETPVSTNMLQDFEQYALSLGVDFAIANFLAAFNATERTAVEKVMDLHRTKIDDQLEELEALIAKQEEEDEAE